MKFGAGSPKVDIEDVLYANLGESYATDKKGVIHLNKKYLETLGDKEQRELYKTIIHEGLHYTRPAKLQIEENKWDHDYIDPEAARRTAKDQSDHNKERHKCGCDKEPLTLSIQPPGLPIIYEPKM